MTKWIIWNGCVNITYNAMVMVEMVLTNQEWRSNSHYLFNDISIVNICALCSQLGFLVKSNYNNIKSFSAGLLPPLKSGKHFVFVLVYIICIVWGFQPICCCNGLAVSYYSWSQCRPPRFSMQLPVLPFLHYNANIEHILCIGVCVIFCN